MQAESTVGLRTKVTGIAAKHCSSKWTKQLGVITLKMLEKSMWFKFLKGKQPILKLRQQYLLTANATINIPVSCQCLFKQAMSHESVIVCKVSFNAETRPEEF